MELFHDVEFWIALAFIVAVVVLIKKAAPGITGGLDARAARIKEEIEEAKRLRAEAEATLAEYQRKQRRPSSPAPRKMPSASAARPRPNSMRH